MVKSMYKGNLPGKDDAAYTVIKWSTLIWLVLFVFGVLLASLALSGAAWVFFRSIGMLTAFSPEQAAVNAFLFLLLASLVIATGLTAIVGKSFLRPLRRLENATKQIASGNFNVHIPTDGSRELLHLAESFNEMAKALTSIETLRTDFVSNISHEFKTPLASIKGFVKLLMKKNLSDEQSGEYSQIIMSEIERLSRLSSNVLLLSKLESAKKETEQSEYYLDEQIRRSLLLLEPQLQKKQLRTEINLEEVKIAANEEMLHHVWINLLGNAVKYSHDGGVIKVSLMEMADHAKITISDQGIGMDAEVKRRMFEKFYQGDRSRGTEGNGLGLALVQRILELEGGTVEVNSEPGAGSEFAVSLPRPRGAGRITA